MRSAIRISTVVAALSTAALSTAALSACGEKVSGVGGAIGIVATDSVLSPGDTSKLSVIRLDGSVAPILLPSVTWTSGTLSVATVSSDGIVVAIAEGTSEINANVDGHRATQRITVQRRPVRHLSIAIEASAVYVGETIDLSFRATDAAGEIVSGVNPVWVSSDVSRLSLANNGKATGIAAGNALLSARIEDVEASIAITVRESSALAITSVAPSPLIPGHAGLLIGHGFSGLRRSNDILINGKRARVLDVSEQQISFVTPCIQEGIANITAVSRGLVATASTTMSAPSAAVVASQEQWVQRADDLASCVSIVGSPKPSTYLVALFNPESSADSLADVSLVASRTDASEQAMPTVTYSIAPERSFRQVTDVVDDFHVRMLKRDIASYRPLRSMLIRRPAQRTIQNSLNRMLQLSFLGNCGQLAPKARFRTVHSGLHVDILEDENNLISTLNSSLLRSAVSWLGTQADLEQYQTVRNYFGDPLRRDHVLDADGKLSILISSRVNATGAIGVTSICDQYESGNRAELIYISSPTSDGADVNNPSSVAGWRAVIGRTIVHEMKHLSSHAARVANGAQQLEEFWLEEGLARVAEEVWVRDYVYRSSRGSNLGFSVMAAGGLYCDFSLADLRCVDNDPAHRPSAGLSRHFSGLLSKLETPWDYSPFGSGFGQSASSYYQTSWAFLRFLLDDSRQSEEMILRSLNSSALRGVRNLENATRLPISESLGRWGLALFIDDMDEVASPSLTLSSWNMRQIWSNWTQVTRTQTSWREFPVPTAELPCRSFRNPVAGIRGGAHFYATVRCEPNASLLLSVEDLQLPRYPSTARLALFRLK